MSIEYRIVEAPFTEALGTIRRSLNGHMSRASRIYIGSTTNPEGRWNGEHAANGWTRMIVLWKAWGPDWATRMERELIAHVQRCNFLLDRANRAPGGEGIVDRPDHFVYVLLA